MPFSDAIRIGASGAADTTYTVDRSLRFNKSDSMYLERTPSSTGNQKVWTWSAWFKRTLLHDTGGTTYLFSCNNVSGNDGIAAIYINNDKINTYFDTSGSNPYGAVNDRLYRDVGAWMHIVWQVDAANTSQRIWINGVEETLNSGNNPPDFAYGMNQSGIKMFLGRDGDWGSDHSNIYFAEVHFSDGNKYEASDFAETNSETGQWVPKSPSITYGTNGYYLNFSDNSGTTATTLGKDSSGNSNNFTPTNFSVSTGLGNDSMKDTPTNNFATFNPLLKVASSSAYTNGALEFAASSTGQKRTGSTFAHDSGKWYAEFRLDSYSSASGSYPYIGVAPNNVTEPGSGESNTWIGYIGTAVNSAGAAYKDGSSITGGFSYAAGDIIGMALDVDNLLVYFYKNGTIQNSGTGYAITANTDKGYQFNVSLYASSGKWAANFGGIGIGSNSDANGHGNFTYAVPSGYLAECTANLPEPSIALPNKHFGTLLYSAGSSNGTFTFTDSDAVDFFPDFTWIKCRDASEKHFLMDAIRGNVDIDSASDSKWLISNTNEVEGNGGGHLDGATVSSVQNGIKIVETSIGSGEIYFTNRNYVTWNWNAGGSTVTNNDGATASQVRANTSAGFSIVTYTGTGDTSETYGHGLGVKPDCIIVKCRNTAGQDWVMYHKDLNGGSSPAERVLKLNTTAAEADLGDVWYDTEPTSSVFTVGDEYMVNGSSSLNYVAYCFSGVAGYSKFGSYKGNGSSDGTFVSLGFKPAFLILKGADNVDNWFTIDNKRDTSNVCDTLLRPNTNETDFTFTTLDFLSNGFKIRSDNSAFNTNGNTYIYLAFAESPFRNARAR